MRGREIIGAHQITAKECEHAFVNSTTWSNWL
jgi:hypothetical protein